MTPDEFTDHILGKPVKRTELIPKGASESDMPILFGQQPGVIRIKMVKDENGEFRASDDPENIEAIKELFAWLPRDTE